jgi:hypothetical protein
MLKAIFYLGAAAIGIVASLFSPLAGAIACVEAYLLNPRAMDPSDGGFRYQFWTTIAFLTGLLLHRARPAARAAGEARILWIMWAFVGVCVLSASWAIRSPETAFQGAFQLFKIMVVTSGLVWALRTESDVSWFWTACIVGVLHAAFLHSFGMRLGYISPSLDRGEGVLITGQSQVMVLFIPLLILLSIRGVGLQRWLALVTIPFALNSIVKTYQRTAFAALLLEGALLLWLLPRRMTLRILPLLALAGCLFVFRLTPEDYWQRMRTIEDPQHEASAASRFLIARTSWKMFQDYPLGVGYQNYQFVSPRYLNAAYLTEGRRSSHNSFFAVLCDTGVEGFIFWASATAMALVTLRGIRKNADTANPRLIEVYAMAVEVGLYGWLATGLFGDQSGLDPAYWFLGATVVLARLAVNDPEDPRAVDDMDISTNLKVSQ